MVLEIESTAHYQQVAGEAGSKPIVIDFFATWCGPCVMIKPFFEELSQQYHDKAVFIKIDVDKCEELSMQFSISAMPTFAVVKDGAKIDELVGASKDKLQ